MQFVIAGLEADLLIVILLALAVLGLFVFSVMTSNRRRPS